MCCKCAFRIVKIAAVAFALQLRICAFITLKKKKTRKEKLKTANQHYAPRLQKLSFLRNCLVVKFAIVVRQTIVDKLADGVDVLLRVADVVLHVLGTLEANHAHVHTAAPPVVGKLFYILQLENGNQNERN